MGNAGVAGANAAEAGQHLGSDSASAGTGPGAAMGTETTAGAWTPAAHFGTPSWIAAYLGHPELFVVIQAPLKVGFMVLIVLVIGGVLVAHFSSLIGKQLHTRAVFCGATDAGSMEEHGRVVAGSAERP